MSDIHKLWIWIIVWREERGPQLLYDKTVNYVMRWINDFGYLQNTYDM